MNKLETLKKERALLIQLIAAYELAYEFSLVSEFDSFERIPGDVGLQDRIEQLTDYQKLIESEIYDICHEDRYTAEDIDYKQSIDEAYNSRNK
jgi:hypothetical protein